MLNAFKYIIAGVIASSSVCAHADLLDDGRRAFKAYDFEKASSLYSQFAQSLKKRPNPERERLLEEYERQLEIADNFLSNVQQIEIIDRIDVPSDEFLNAIRLPISGGQIRNASLSPFKEARGGDFIFSDESGDFIMWTQEDSHGLLRIAESTRLTDGSWEQPILESETLNDGGNARNPFMLTDGTTLYFTADGEGSMGGYDIFIATKDPSTGEYRQPINLGFPFNSPANEYLLAVDEENGVGWWVTDRNNLDGQVSIYVYLTSDVRRNYNPDEEDNLTALASASDISLTQNPAADYSIIKKRIARSSSKSSSGQDSDFTFAMPGGNVYTKLSDFSAAASKRIMQQYLAAQKEQEDDLNRLDLLRRRYHSGGKASSAAISNQILDLEKKTERQREKLKTMRNSIITSESKGKGSK